MRNPVLFAMSVLAGLSAVLGLSVLQDLISPTTLGWLLVAQAGLTASMQFWVRGQVTPLVDPRDDTGRRLWAKPLIERE